MTLSTDRRRLYLTSWQYDRSGNDRDGKNTRTRLVTFDVEALLR